MKRPAEPAILLKEYRSDTRLRCEPCRDQTGRCGKQDAVMQRTKRAPDRAGTAPPRTTRLHEASRWALHPQVRGLFIAFRMTRGFPTGVRVGGVGFFEGRTSTRSTLAERLASTRAHPMPARALTSAL